MKQAAEHSTAVRYREDRVIEQALLITENRMRKPGQKLNDPAAMRAWLKLHLALQEREVFVCLSLDNQHRLITSES